MKKKLISAVLCAALAVTSISSASAAVSQDVPTSTLRYQVINKTTLDNNKIYLYKSNINHGYSFDISLTDFETGHFIQSFHFNFDNNTLTSHPVADQTYGYWVGLGGNLNSKISFATTGGTYEKIRVKLCDLASYFNENGTHTFTFSDGNPHDYNFTNEGNGYYSFLVFLSGGVFSAVAPDENGYVYIYVSTKIGEKTYYITDFAAKTANTSSAGGGTSGTSLYGFVIGDVNKNSFVELADAAIIQKHTLNPKGTNLDELALRNADVDRNGKINLLDAINVQKYVLKL